MNRRIIALYALPTMAAVLCVGCGNRTTTTPAQPVTVAQVSAPIAPAPPPGTFQPYTLIPNPAPKPQIVVKKHNVLHVVRRGKTVYLADQTGRSFLAGRDQQGRLYPVYQSPETHQNYPLYYDSTRDNYYREAQADNGAYYRNYVGAPADQYYQNDSSQPYDDPAQAYQDYQPEIVGSNGADYNYNPTVGEHHRGHQDDWLWAIPVVVGAYVLLNQHHHHDSSPNYQYSQNPGGGYGYQGSSGYAQGGYPSSPGNPNRGQPYPAGIGRPPYSAAAGARGSFQQGTVVRQSAYPGAGSRPGGQSSAGRPSVPGRSTTAPLAQTTAAVRFPVRPGSSRPAAAARNQTTKATLARSSFPLRRTVAATRPPIARRSAPTRLAPATPVLHRVAARPHIMVDRPSLRSARPIAPRTSASVPRVSDSVPREVLRPRANAVPRPRFPAVRRVTPVSAPSRPRVIAVPSAPRPAVRLAPRTEPRSAPQLRLSAPVRQTMPMPHPAPAPRLVPAPRAAPAPRSAPAPSRPTPALEKPR